MKNKTAVETLEQGMKQMDIIPTDKNELLISRSDFNKLIFLAKNQEKTQIINAVEWNYKSNMGEVYFNATYGVQHGFR